MPQDIHPSDVTLSEPWIGRRVGTRRALGHSVVSVRPQEGRGMDVTSAATLRDRPLDLRLPPNWVFEHTSWQRARQVVLEALAAGWVAVVVGDSGAGKTLLLRDLARTFAAGGLRVRFSEVGDFPGRPTPGEVRMVDEADVLGDTALRSLALAGGPAVISLLPRSVRVLEGLGARIAVVRLSPLSLAEATDFLAAALDAGQIRQDVFDEGAVTALALASGGMPRQLIVQSRGALFQAEMESAPCVKARHIERAEALRLGVQRQLVDAVPAQAGDTVADKRLQNAPVGSVEATAAASAADLASDSLAGAAGPLSPALEPMMRPADVAAPYCPAARPLAVFIR